MPNKLISMNTIVRFIGLICLFFGSTYAGTAQLQHKVDSLQTAYENLPEGPQQFELLGLLFDATWRIDMDKSQYFAEEHLKLAQQQQDSYQLALANYNMGRYLRSTGDWKELKPYFDKAKSYWEQLGTSTDIVANHGIAHYGYYFNRNDSLLLRINRNLAIQDSLQIRSTIYGKDLYLKARHNVLEENTDEAYQAAYEALKVFEKYHNDLEKADVLEVLARLDLRVPDYQLGLEHAQAALAIFEDLGVATSIIGHYCPHRTSPSIIRAKSGGRKIFSKRPRHVYQNR